jgi:Tol biopolymer transport system component/HEAT repeat protein
MQAIWAAKTENDREKVKPLFKEFLRFLAKTIEAEKQETDLRKRLRNDAYAVQTLYYLAGYALPFLNDALNDEDPLIREQAVLAYAYACEGIGQFDNYLSELNKIGPSRPWAADLRKAHNKEQADWRTFALRALNDRVPAVRIAGITVLTDSDPAGIAFMADGIGIPENRTEESDTLRPDEIESVKTLAKDPDAGVRIAVQKYLTRFAGKSIAADSVSEALADPNPAVRDKALDALLRSPEAPPIEVLKRAFKVTTGKTAVGLIPLLREHEDSTLSRSLAINFVDRSEEERLAIITAIAGHTDTAAVDLIKSGLNDSSVLVQRAALMRLLPLPSAIATPIIEGYLQRSTSQLKRLAEVVKDEIESRSRWRFLKKATSATESVFPSRNGTRPQTSPDGQWIAYEETGWGRPGGSGGFGRSNLISISHVARIDATEDRVVSDMFLVGWMSDSKRVGTARDGFAAISDFDGHVVAEFGNSGPETYQFSSAQPVDWTKGDLRSQFGAFMPHQKHLDGSENYGFGEGGAFSPDGKWYGVLQDNKEMFLLAVDGQRMPIKMREGFSRWPPSTKWSPDGRYLQLSGDSSWLIVDLHARNASYEIKNVDGRIVPGGCSSRCDGNPWSKDGTRLAFVRNGQIWVSDAIGKNAKQITFDSTRKVSPVFSRDGKSIAYLTWQPDNRRQYPRLGPTDLWVVDVESTLALRVTSPATARINSLDWLDDHTLIFDRLQDEEKSVLSLAPSSSLRRLSLANQD